MPTIIGAIFFCCGAYCFCCQEDALFGLLLVASLFEAASGINIGGRGIQSYYIIAVFIIARAFVNRMFGSSPRRAIPQGKWLLIFGVISVASAFVFPIIFAGTPVYDPKIGIDPGLFIRPPLQLSLNNVAQAFYLALHIATAFALQSIKFSASKTRRAFFFIFYLEVLILVAESFCQLAGISFPLSLFLNNPGYALWTNAQETSGTRNPGTFTEPSIAGAFLVIYCVGFMAEYFSGKGRSAKVILSLVASGLVASSSSLLVLCLSPLALLTRYSPFRAPWYINLRQTKRIAWIVFVLVVPVLLALMLFSGYRQILTTLTVSKGESGSFINRTAADLYALQLLLDSRGLGVGLGSNRSSSFLTTLLSNVGLAGSFAFLVFYFKLFTNLPEDYIWLKWGGLALFANMALGIADITMPLMWCPILLAIQFNTYTTARRPQKGVTPIFAGS